MTPTETLAAWRTKAEAADAADATLYDEGAFRGVFDPPTVLRMLDVIAAAQEHRRAVTYGHRPERETERAIFAALVQAVRRGEVMTAPDAEIASALAAARAAGEASMRERAAKVADEHTIERRHLSAHDEGRDDAAREIAEAIRALPVAGEKEGG